MMLGLTLFRMIMIALYREDLAEAGTLPNVMRSLLVGLRFDSMASTYWLLPSILLAVLCGFWNLEKLAEGWRTFVLSAWLFITPVLCCGNFEYYREFHDNFNQFLFNAWYDNKPALLSTAFEQYHMLQHLSGITFTAHC
jgi:hypothetical protein